MSDYHGPNWLAPISVRGGGADFMGLRQPGLTMADALLPGITNTTGEIRYYTVIAWLFAYAKGAGSRQLRVLESAYVHATRAHHSGGAPITGVVGSQSIRVGADPTFDNGLVDHERSPVSTLDGAFYGPSTQALRVAGRNADGVLGISELGAALAKTVAIPRSLRPKKEEISRELVAALQSLCLCQPATGRERDLLEEVLFRHERRHRAREKSEAARRQTLALVLDTLGSTKSPEPDILQTLINHALGRGNYEPPQALSDAADGVALMGLRWHYRHAVEGLWAAVGRIMARDEPNGLSSSPYVLRILDEADGSSAWCPKRNARVGSLLSANHDRRDIELEGHRLFDAELAEKPERAALIAAVQLAVLARDLRLLDRSTITHDEFLDLKAPYWSPMSAFGLSLDPERTLEDWLRMLIDRHVFGQHFLTASRKWTDGIDAFFFHPTGEGYRLSKTRFPNPSQDVRWWLPDAGRTKIPAALSLMRGIGLVREHKGTWSTTERGHNTLARVLENPAGV